MTPQEQAEAMAREMLHSRIHSKTKFEDTLATALSKLIAENERLKKEVRASAWCAKVADNEKAGRVAAEKDLTATEAKLEDAVELVKIMATEVWFPNDSHDILPTELAKKAKAFLSTLTAEKKESDAKL